MSADRPPSQPLTEADLADIGNAIGFAAPSLPSPLPLASVIDLGPLRALASDTAIPEMEKALLAVRESLPADVDAMTVATLRASLRR